MREPDRHNPISFILVLGILIVVAVGQSALAGSEEVAGPMTGQQVYNAVCIACHAPPGVGGAPALGDTDAWAPRTARGLDSLIYNALNGFTGSTGVMPKKGERTDLSDEEIIGAVKYMVEQAVRK